LNTETQFLKQFLTLECDVTGPISEPPTVTLVSGPLNCLKIPASTDSKTQEFLIHHTIESEQFIPFWTFHEDSLTVEDVVLTWRKVAGGEPNSYTVRRSKQTGSNSLNAGELFIWWIKKKDKII